MVHFSILHYFQLNHCHQMAQYKQKWHSKILQQDIECKSNNTWCSAQSREASGRDSVQNVWGNSYCHCVFSYGTWSYPQLWGPTSTNLLGLMNEGKKILQACHKAICPNCEQHNLTEACLPTSWCNGRRELYCQCRVWSNMDLLNLHDPIRHKLH